MDLQDEVAIREFLEFLDQHGYNSNILDAIEDMLLKGGEYEKVKRDKENIGGLIEGSKGNRSGKKGSDKPIF